MFRSTICRNGSPRFRAIAGSPSIARAATALRLLPAFFINTESRSWSRWRADSPLGKRPPSKSLPLRHSPRNQKRRAVFSKQLLGESERLQLAKSLPYVWRDDLGGGPSAAAVNPYAL